MTHSVNKKEFDSSGALEQRPQARNRLVKGRGLEDKTCRLLDNRV